METEEKIISLDKGEQQFHIRYSLGDEQIVIETLIDMVKNPDLNFDWFDAAVMSHEAGQGLAKDVRKSLKK